MTFELPLSHGGIRKEFDFHVLRFKKENPTISVCEHEDLDSSLQDILRGRQADVAFLFNPAIECSDWQMDDNLRFIPVPERKRGPFYLWLAVSHRLASRDRLGLEDLSGCRFLIPSNIRYQGLERLADSGEPEWGIPVEWTFWPGDFEDCLLNAGSEEVALLGESDLGNPVLDLVPDRILVPLDGVERLIEPCFVYLGDNENPVLKAFESFMLGLSD